MEEEEEEPAVEVKVFGGEPSLKLEDPLASPPHPRNTILPKRTPAPLPQVPTIPKKVTVPPLPPKYATMTESDFTEEMAQSIFGIVLESVALFKKDPREYHPFYLRVYKYLTIGQRLGFLSKEPEEVNRLWTEFSDFARRQFEKGRGKRVAFTGEKSPYAYFMQNRKVMIDGKLVPPPWTDKERNHRFDRLNRLVEKMRREWQETRGKEGGSIKDDLELRLGFLKESMSICYPGYTDRTNNLWSVLLQEPPQKKKASRKRAARDKKAVSHKGEDSREVKRIVVKVVVPQMEEEEVKVETTDSFVDLPASPFRGDSPAAASPEPEPDVTNLPTSSKVSKVDDKIQVDKSTPPVIVPFPRKRIKRRKHFKPKPVTTQNVTVVQKKRMVSRLLKPKKAVSGPKRQLMLENLIRKRSLPQPKLKPKPTDKQPAVPADLPATEEVDIPAPVVEDRIPEPKAVEQVPEEKPKPAPLPKKTVLIPKRKKPVIPKSKPLPGNQRKKKALAQLNRAECQKERQMKLEMKIAKMGSRKAEHIPSPPASPLPPAPSSPFPSAPNSPCPASPPASPPPPASPSPITPPQASEGDLVKCPECHKDYAPDYLPVHQEVVHRQDASQCVVCNESFPDPRKLWVHFSRLHLRHYNLGSLDPASKVPVTPHPRISKKETTAESPAVFTCEHCGKQLSTSKNLERHIHATHTDPEILAQQKLQCPYCPTQFKVKDSLDFHIRKQHLNSVNSRCPHCSKDLNTPGKLWRHMIDAHSISITEATDFCQVKTAQCCYCGQPLLADGRVQNSHVATEHPERLAEFLGSEKAGVPRKYVRKPRPNRNHAEEYRRRSKHKGREKRRLAHAYSDGQCPECGITLAFTKLALHRRRTHGVMPEDNVPCPCCELTFSTKDHLRSHLRCEHTRRLERLMEERGLVTPVERTGHCVTVYRCVQCETYVRGVEEAKIHVVAKHKEAVLQAAENWEGAEEIPETLSPKRKRIKIRVKGPPSNQSGRELEAELNKIPMECVICGRTIKLWSLNRHFKKVHGILEDGDMLVCPLCGRRYQRRGGFLRHMKTRHEPQLDMDAELKRLGKPNTIADPDTVIKNAVTRNVPPGKKLLQCHSRSTITATLT